MIPAPPPTEHATERERLLDRQVEAVARDIANAIERFALHEALESVWRLVAAANAYVDQTAPWVLARTEAERGRQPALDRILYTLLDVLRAVAQFLEPFLPSAAREILTRLGHADVAAGVPKLGELRPGHRVQPGPPLFPKPPSP